MTQTAIVNVEVVLEKAERILIVYLTLMHDRRIASTGRDAQIHHTFLLQGW